MSKKGFSLGLLPRIVAAIALGTCLGFVLPMWAVKALATFNSLFSELLGFLVPLIIIGLVTPAIASLGRGGGRMLAWTVAFAYLATVLAGLLSYGVSANVFPHLIESQIATSAESLAAISPEPYFTISIPPAVGVMTALVLSFVFGLGIAYSDGKVLRTAAEEAREVVVKTINKVIIPLLPIYIMGIFTAMTAMGQVVRVLSVFASIIAVIFALHIGWLLFLYCVAGTFTGNNPLRLLWGMMPAYFTALGTQSSAATIPVTLECAKNNGVRADVAGLVVPLCATIHLSGSMLKIVACAAALMIMQGAPVELGRFAGFICMLAVTMVAAPGVPGGAIMAALGVLSSMLGFTETDLALMIALYIAMDCFGTACNVTGDGAIALVVDKYFAGRRTETE